MTLKTENLAGAVIFFIIAIVAFILFGVNKASQNKMRTKYSGIDSVTKESNGQLKNMPQNLSIKEYENYKSTWENTWLWIGIVCLVIMLAFLFIN